MWRSVPDGNGRDGGRGGGGWDDEEATLVPVLCLLDPGLGGPRRSRAEDGGGGRMSGPGFVVGTEGNAGGLGRADGTEGRVLSRSFNSSIDGKACANSDSVRVG